jgi:hypothetical protein
MDDTPGQKGSERPVGRSPGDPARETRLKAALKANMARRKAQARAREGAMMDTTDPEPETDGQQQDG